jgi:hypothetical protein
MKCLSLQQAISIMENGKPFSLRVVSFDKKRKTGGKVKFYDELIKVTPDHLPAAVASNSTPRTPNHHTNMTRNYAHAINGRDTAIIVRIHLYGILEVNNIKVAL